MVRLTQAGVGSLPVATQKKPEADTFRVPRKRGREKLNDERGEEPLPVSSSRDVSRTGKIQLGTGKGEASVFYPPKSVSGKPETANVPPLGSVGLLWTSGQQHALTNVTAVRMSLNNRARRVAAGVMPGADANKIHR